LDSVKDASQDTVTYTKTGLTAGDHIVTLMLTKGNTVPWLYSVDIAVTVTD